MLRSFTACAVGALISSTAFAADQLYYTPGQAEPAFTPYVQNWTGHYVGAQAGGGWNEVDTSFVTSVPTSGSNTFDADGGMFGLQVGANWQDQLVVWGVQADGSWTGFDGNDGGAFGAVDSVDTNYLLAATANVGIAIDHYKPYVLGGLAVVDYDYDLSNLAGTAVESRGQTEVGGVLGAGLEVAVAPNVSIFGEYRHYWFDGDGMAFAGPGAVPAQTITPEFGIDTVNAGINWRF